jgi:hypothetical protein
MLFINALFSLFICCSAWGGPRLSKLGAIGSLVPLTLTFCPHSSGASGIKQCHLPASAITKIVGEDITVRQALITADFTRSIYSESATFQDEIDTYEIDKYVTGTKALFDADQSHVDLVGDVSVTGSDTVEGVVSFRFKETLAFNVPLLKNKPKVRLTGRVELQRDSQGLVEKSREFWDQDVGTVLRTAFF